MGMLEAIGEMVKATFIGILTIEIFPLSHCYFGLWPLIFVASR